MRNLKSLLLTLVCMGVILGIGYLGIVEWGRRILSSEGVLVRVMKMLALKFFMGKLKIILKSFPGIIILRQKIQ